MHSRYGSHKKDKKRRVSILFIFCLSIFIAYMYALWVCLSIDWTRRMGEEEDAGGEGVGIHVIYMIVFLFL